MKIHDSAHDDPAEAAPLEAHESRVIRIKGSDTPYAGGGVFEASKFAKGDGWKKGPPSDVLHEQPGGEAQCESESTPT